MGRWAWVLACVLVSIGTVQGAPADGAVAAIESYLRQYQDAGAFDGVVLVAEGEEVAYRQAFGKASYELDVPMRVDHRFRIASLSKQVTQALVGRLVDRGQLDLDAPIAEVLPGFAHGDRITAAQLVENTAGVPHTNTQEWMDTTKTLMLPEIVERLSAMPLDFDPGERRRYSNGGYAVLAAVLEAASGTSYAQLLRQELVDYPSIGHEGPFELVPQLVSRYAPGERYGTRAKATTYHVWNRIGGGSLYASADDVFRLFHDTQHARLVSAPTTARLFPMPKSSVLVTGRSPGALAQVWFDPASELSVVMLSSNSAWPASLTRDIARLYRGEAVDLLPFAVAESATDSVEGNYRATRFAWEVTIERAADGHLVWVKDELRTALVPTRVGGWHLPIYDWLCTRGENADAADSALSCRQRDPESDVRFVFNPVAGEATP